MGGVLPTLRGYVRCRPGLMPTVGMLTGTEGEVALCGAFCRPARDVPAMGSLRYGCVRPGDGARAEPVLGATTTTSRMGMSFGGDAWGGG